MRVTNCLGMRVWCLRGSDSDLNAAKEHANRDFWRIVICKRALYDCGLCAGSTKRACCRQRVCYLGTRRQRWLRQIPKTQPDTIRPATVSSIRELNVLSLIGYQIFPSSHAFGCDVGDIPQIIWQPICSKGPAIPCGSRARTISPHKSCSQLDIRTSR